MQRLATLVVGMLVFTVISGIGIATEVIVGPGSSIQTAVSSASSGDVIIVKPGTYTENIRIITQDLVIRSESGNPEDTIITARDLRTNVFSLEQANNTSISGFNIAGSGDDYSGVYLVRCSNCTITNNNLSDNYQGVYLRYSDHNSVLNNVILGRYKGVYLQDSSYNTISGNGANSSTQYGIHLTRSQKNTLSNNIANSNKYGIVLENANHNNLTKNIVHSNSVYGLYLTNSSNCGLTDNTASSNDRGIYLIRSNSTVISGNKVSENNAYGILTSYSNYNIISGNTANKTFRGIHLDSSDGNTVSGNNVASNSVSGLFMCAGSDSNRVFNNHLNNTYNADIRNTKNTWNTTRTAGTNIVGGSYIGGNFWANPSGTGFSQTAQDADRDGIADREYAGKNYTDYLPLVSTSGRPQSLLPVANFTANITSGNAPLAVQFTDTSKYATGWKWDFENDGTVDSSVQNPVHVYAAAGTYTVSLTASNVNGTALKTATITVSEQSKPLIPVANFTANTTQGNAPLTVQFTDTSQYATGRNWDFENDGTVDSSIQNPVHVFTASGTYTVNLTATSANGTNSKFMTITVYDPSEPVTPAADFTANVTSGYAPLAVQFTDLSQNTVSWSWDFDNNGQSESTIQNPVYVYENPGDYTVNLIVSNANGTDSETLEIKVQEAEKEGLPVADFSANVTSGYAPLSVLFTDLSKSATETGWDFNNDGEIEVSSTTIVYVYALPGTYTINLIATNKNGTNSKFMTITVYDPSDPAIPTADFTANVTSGYAPLAVQFAGLSQDTVSWSWDFDSDGIYDSYLQNPIHVYETPGTYTVNLNASNQNGTTSKTAILNVLKKSNSGGGSSEGGSSSGGSSGGGGGGGSPEPSRNVQVKELCQVFIANGDAVKFDFKRNATCVVYVSFDAKKTVGKTTTIVEQLKNKSALVSSLPEGEVYKSINVWVGNSGFASLENIENPAICFKVEKAWIQEKGVDQASIALYRYSNKTWEQMPVNLSGEDSKYLYFTTRVQGFSFFAITGTTTASSEESVAETGPEQETGSIEEEKIGNKGSGVEKELEQVENLKAPGLEIASGVACLLAVFLYIRKIKK